MTDTAAITDDRTDKTERTQTYIVLQRDPNTIETVTRWVEVDPISGTGPHGYWPTAADLGKKYGEGDYLLIEDRGPDLTRYISGFRISVVADRYYREADREEATA